MFGIERMTEVEAEEKWIIYGYDAQDFEVFVYINNSRPAVSYTHLTLPTTVRV